MQPKQPLILKRMQPKQLDATETAVYYSKTKAAETAAPETAAHHIEAQAKQLSKIAFTTLHDIAFPIIFPSADLYTPFNFNRPGSIPCKRIISSSVTRRCNAVA